MLEDEREADRGDERGEAGAAAQRPVGEPFGADGDGDGEDHAEQDHDGEGDEDAGAVGEPEPGGEGSEASDHEYLAVGEVDELNDAIDHRVTDCDESVQRAE